MSPRLNQKQLYKFNSFLEHYTFLDPDQEYLNMRQEMMSAGDICEWIGLARNHGNSCYVSRLLREKGLKPRAKVCRNSKGQLGRFYLVEKVVSLDLEIKKVMGEV